MVLRLETLLEFAFELSVVTQNSLLEEKGLEDSYVLMAEN